MFINKNFLSVCFTWTAVAMSKKLNKLKKKIKFPKIIRTDEKVLNELEKIFNNKEFFRDFLNEFRKIEEKEIIKFNVSSFCLQTTNKRSY